MKIVAVIIVMCVSNLVFAQKNCKEVESGFAFFDGKKSQWIESSKIKIFDCDSNYKISFVEVKTQKELDAVVVKKPSNKENWYLDGLACNESIKKNGKNFRNKIVLSPVISEEMALNPIESWAVNIKSNKFEKLTSKLSCHKDEP